MKVLVNCDPSEVQHLKTLDYYLKQMGFEGCSTSKTLTPTDAVALAARVDCAAIIISNPATLAKFVPSESPSLDKWRGSRINTSIPAFVINPIVHVYAVPEGDFLLRKDLESIKYARVPVQPFRYTVLKRVDQFAEWLEKAKRCILMGADIETAQHGMKRKPKSSKRVPVFHPGSLDIAGLGDTWITCNGWSLLMPDGSIETCVLPLVNGTQDYWARDQDYAAALGFLRAMYDVDAPKLFHNGLYDAFHLIRYRAFPRRWTLDSMGFSHSWYSELPKTLNFLASWTLYDAYYWKDLADSEHKSTGNIESYWLYNAKDCWAMVRAFSFLLRNAPTWAFTNYQKNFKNVYPSLYGAFEGWHVNQDTRDRLALAANEKLMEAKGRLQIIADDPKFNPSSHKQVSELLYEVMGGKKNPRAKSAGATDAKSRTYVAAQHPLLARVSELLNSYAKEAKAISTYFSFLLYHSRLMFSVDPFGTETSRAASRGSAAWVGTQIQNQPYYAKEMYEPDPGYIGFEIDYSKAEAVCTAYLSQCLPLIKALKDPDLDANGKPKDLYKHLGTLFFGMPYEEVTTEFRNKVLKKINHGTNYMMGAGTFIDNLDSIDVLYFAADLLSVKLLPSPNPTNPKEMTMTKFAQSLLDSYHRPFAEVKPWWNSLKDEVASTKMLVSPTGHVRYFFGDPNKDHKVWRSAVAHQPQNLSVENLNGGQFRAYKYAQEFRDPSAIRLKTQIHDSLNGQVKIEYAREAIPKLAELVRAECMVHGRLMTIDVDVEVYHTNWKEKVGWKNFSETILPMLESQKLLTSSTAGPR